MRAVDLVRDLLEPAPPANAANPANSVASAAFAGLRTAANPANGDRAEDPDSQDSQAFATAENERQRGVSQHLQDSHGHGVRSVRWPASAARADYERRVRQWLDGIGENDRERIEQIVAAAVADPGSLAACVPPPAGWEARHG